jgi:hypothetical protein
MMTDDEIERLGILVSEVPQAPPPLPRYATDIMPTCIKEDEALEWALQNSAPHLLMPPLPSFNLWPAPLPPPAYAPPAAN